MKIPTKATNVRDAKGGALTVRVLRDLYRRANCTLAGSGIARFRWVAMANEKIVSMLSHGIQETETAFVNGFQMYLPKSDKSLRIRGISEPDTVNYFNMAVKPGMTAVDIGAHVGYYTLLFSRLVGEAGEVFAFEPEAENFEMLQKNVALNGPRNVTLMRKAVSNGPGPVLLHLSLGNPGGHSIFPIPSYHRTIEVESVSLDDYMDAIGRKIVDVVKIDVEGAEYVVLLGMTRSLQRNHDIQVVMEYSPHMLRNAGFHPSDPLRLLADLGFGLNDIGRRSIKRRTIQELLDLYDRAGDRNAMLLCSRSTISAIAGGQVRSTS